MRSLFPRRLLAKGNDGGVSLRLLGIAAIAAVILSGCGGGENHFANAPTHGGVGGKDNLPTAIQRIVSLRPLRGIAYKPSPSDYNGNGQGIYYDSDFANDDFKQLWGPSGRDDIGKFATVGVNFVHLYDWNQPGSGRNHSGFLTYCQQKNICVAVPISNYYVGQVQQGNALVASWFDAMVAEVYPGGKRHPAVGMWTLGNEYDNSGGSIPAQAIAQTAAAMIAAEDRANIPATERVAFTSPVTFGIRGATGVEGADATLQLQQAFSDAGLTDAFSNRFIAAVNSFNPGSDLGPWAATRFPNATNNLPFCLFEMGKEIGADVQTEDQQGAFYAAQLAATMPVAKGSGAFLGQCIFSSENEAWKGGTEATFGVYKISAPGGIGTGTTTNGQTYPIDTLAQKPNFTSMQSAYSGQ